MNTILSSRFLSAQQTTTMKIHCLFLLTLLIPLPSQGHVTPFSTCLRFFVNGAPPTILRDQNKPDRYQQICQCLLDQAGSTVYFYATLYDTKNKIPVYSAYLLGTGRGTTNRRNPWYSEPEVLYFQLNRTDLKHLALSFRQYS